MYKTLIAGVAALSLTLTPAQANGFDEDDLGKLLFGLVAAVVVGQAIKNANDGDRVQGLSHGYAPSVVQPRTHAPRINPGRQDPPVVRHNRGDRGGILPNRARVLPGKCFTRVETRFGTQNMFGRHCLRNNYRQFARLPSQCEVRVLTDDGARRGFDPRCLRQQGFSSTRR